MKQKAILTAAALLLLTFGASAQTYVNAGIGTTDKITTIEGLDPSTVTLTTLFAGLSHNFQLPFNLGVEAGVNYYTSSDTQEMTSLENSCVKRNCSGLMIPVDVNYSLGIGDLLTVSVFAGPTFNYGFNSTTTTIHAGKEAGSVDSYVKETEAQFLTAATFGASAKVSSFRLKVSYQIGLTDIGLTDYTTIDENFLTVGIGFAF